MTPRFQGPLFIAAVLAAPVFAQPAREGPVDLVMCFGGPMHVIAATPSERFGSYVVKGGTGAADPHHDSLASECAGTFETRQGKTQSRGYCVFRDMSGDTLLGIDEMRADGSYVWHYTGGTGKFKGISGNGTVERWGTLAPEAGQMRGCRRLVGSYRIL